MEKRNDPFWSDDISVLYNQERLIEFFPTKDMNRNEKLNSLARFFIYAGLLLALQQREASPLYLAVFGMSATYFIYKNVGGMNDLSGLLQDNKDVKPVIKVGDIKTGITDKKVRFADGINREFTDIDGNPYEYVDGEVDPVLVRRQMDAELNGGDGSEEMCAMPTPNNPFMNYQVAGDDPRRFSIPPCQYEDTIDQEGVKDQVEEYFDERLYKDVGEDIYERNNSQREFYTVPIHDQSSYANWLYNSPPTCKEDTEMCLEYEDLRAKRSIFPNPQDNPISSKLP